MIKLIIRVNENLRAIGISLKTNKQLIYKIYFKTSFLLLLNNIKISKISKTNTYFWSKVFLS